MSKPRTSRFPTTRHTASEAQARALTTQNPLSHDAWKSLGLALLRTDPGQAKDALARALDLAPEDPVTLDLLAQAEGKTGNHQQAENHLLQALALKPDFGQACGNLAVQLREQGKYPEALKYIDQAERLAPRNKDIRAVKASILGMLYRYDEALAIFEELSRRQPKNAALWNEMANIKRELGCLKEAETCYGKAIALAPGEPIFFSNRITLLHYDPDYSQEAIFKASTQWQPTFAPEKRTERPKPGNMPPNRTLRIGMFSDGFRAHPVGWMITTALENLQRHNIEIHAYSTNSMEDAVTARIKKVVAHWMPVQHLSDTDFAQRIRDDKIDILFDLCGHNAGSRMKAVAMEPAPIIVKWVGGLINTTGVDAIDYLLSDNIETPQGADAFFTEKLIRLPDDYICFTPPPYLPPVESLPARTNGYITFGCFNKPTKINDVLMSHWAAILREVPGSHLLLKSQQFNSPGLRNRVLTAMVGHGIEPDRLEFEEGADHRTLLQSYGRVDIALDPWPYSGGLTTVEAMVMGVPVVTLPGPTFSGRHAATHLVNASMPELVVNSWDEYESRAIGLAADLDSLTIIRSRLRDIVMGSPLCDARRFARHFTTAMRAIWQRYCQGQAPAALTIDPQGKARFEDSTEPVTIAEPDQPQTDAGNFRFSFKGKILAVDNGGTLADTEKFKKASQFGAFSTVVFDPSSRLNDIKTRFPSSEIHHYPHTTLGNGHPATLYACVNPADSATLRPVSNDGNIGKVIAELPIQTIRLDDIGGLEKVDCLVLDNANNGMDILEHGTKALDHAMLVQIRVNFMATHENQSEPAAVMQWMKQCGFEPYTLIKPHYHSHLDNNSNLRRRQATQLAWADALFIPNLDRRHLLSNNQCVKLAFLLHTIYDIHDLAYALLSQADPDNAHAYLVANHYLANPAINNAPQEEQRSDTRHVLAPTSPEKSYSVPDMPRMTNSETALFLKYISKARRYFEYGSGGSTKLAIRHNIPVYGVESDSDWVNQLRNDTGPLCHVDYVDIGPTKEWGYPTDMSAKARFHLYSEHIQQFDQPFDFILIDGRFRVACAMNAIKHTLHASTDPSATRLFIHDFWDRPYYHAVLEFVEDVERSETAGVFKIRADISQQALRDRLKDYELDFR